ncbi:uncharacterized protein [Primulina eburnea]|uniref:uncharacterized protein n=1 Tax=Primulina eburnea TaxID=1245227 RepID=UPI003C6BDF09
MAGEEDSRTLMELHRPAFGGYGSSIMIQLQVKFGGSPSEDPNAHLENFLSICDTIKCNGVSTDAIRLRLFPFSLQGEAMEWLRDLLAGSIHYMGGISRGFHAQHGRRFKKMLRMCPRHGFSVVQQVETFYYGVDPSVRSMLDAAANESNVGWQDNQREKKVGFLEMDALTAITAKLDGLTHQMAQLQEQKSIPIKSVNQIQGSAEIVGGSSSDTPFLPDMSCEGIQCFGGDSHPAQQKPPQQPPKPPQGAGPSMPPGFKPQDSKSNLEDMLAKYIAENEMIWQNHDAMMQRVETQLGQLATQMATQAPGSLPSDTEKNPKGVNAIMVTSPIKQEGERSFSSNASYAKFLKEILSNKRKLVDFETVKLSEECSAILQNKLPPKLKDPGSFSIPCTIGSSLFSKALCDPGASINLMPYSCFEKLGIGEVKPTTISLQLADRSIKYPRGVVEDVLVNVDKFIFPMDFVVLDMEEDREIPLILGRPFLATGKDLIDVHKGELVLRLNDESVVFNVFQSIKYPHDTSDCFRIDATDEFVECGLQELIGDDPLEICLTDSCPVELENEEIKEYMHYLEADRPISKNGTEEEKLLRVLRDNIKAIGWSIADIKGINSSMCTQNSDGG